MSDAASTRAVKWRKSLNEKSKKVKKRDLKLLLASRVISVFESGKGQSKMTTLIGLNYEGRRVRLINSKEDECYRDLATLNGVTVE